MQFRNLDLNLLVALDALLTERSVTRAGERIFRTQPAMSGIPSRLRVYFNDELLIRVGNSTEITPLAEQLKDPVREFLAMAHYISEFKPVLDPIDLEHMFVLAMSDYAADFIVPKLLAILSVEAPNVRLRLRTMDYNYWESLETRGTDFVILPIEHIVGQAQTEEVLRDRWVCIADARRHAGNTLSAAAFSAAQFVTVNYYHGRTQTTFERQFADAGLEWSAVTTVPYFQMLPRLISGSDFLAVVHERTARRDAPTYGLRILEIPIELEALTLHLCMHERSNHSRPHQWLKGVIRRACLQIMEK
jgi:LysR family nod box-dependent transcriptional activator